MTHCLHNLPFWVKRLSILLFAILDLYLLDIRSIPKSKSHITAQVFPFISWGRKKYIWRYNFPMYLDMKSTRKRHTTQFFKKSIWDYSGFLASFALACCLCTQMRYWTPPFFTRRHELLVHGLYQELKL